MEVTSDILLKGKYWTKAIDELGSIFKTRTNYQIFMLSLAIGIMYDKMVERPEDEGEYQKSVPRNIIANNDNGKLDYCFQTAILSSTCINLPEKERLELAFGEKADFNKVTFLIKFANYGVEKLAELIGDSPIESMDNIKNFMIASVEGDNWDLESIPDDILLEEA